MVRFLELQGFTVVRVRGSHHVMARDTQRTQFQFMATVRSKLELFGVFLRDIDMSPDEFERLWDRDR